MIVRHTKILELVSENLKVEVVKLSQILKVSQVTIRKDLDFLEEKGLVKREHGYAMLKANNDITTRLAYHYDLKQKIAQVAAAEVKNGDTVMIESGSCCCLVASELSQTKKDLTIITNSAFIANYIRKDTHNHIILLGGNYQKEAQVNVGPITKLCVQNFYVDKFFVGTDGFREQSGFTGNDYLRCETIRDMAKQAEQVIIVSESTKFQRKGVVSLMPMEDIKVLITDDQIPIDKERFLERHNIEVKKAHA